MQSTLKETLTKLYTGSEPRSRRFRIALIVFDVVTILLFIAMAPFEPTLGLELFGFMIGLIILTDFAARIWIADDRIATMKQVYMVADLIVVISLLIGPFIHANLAFLRILRGLRVVHSFHLLRDLRRISPFFMRHENAVIAAVNLFVFVFFTTSVVFALFVERNAGVEGYVDALYFTVATLTTTGYGDITPTTPAGKLLAVLIMVIGVALFVQLARAIVKPSKVNFTCKSCGLTKHDLDAVHCKHCGERLRIETAGLT